MKKFLVYFIVCFMICSNAAFSQIKVTSNGYVGLGAGNTSPSAAVDILGYTIVRPSSSGSYACFSTLGTYYWSFGSSSQYTGYIGYYSTLYGLEAQYVYAATLQTSDERLKKNIQPLYPSLPVIKKLKPVTFDYNIDYSKVENEKLRTKLQNDDNGRVGFIAQEVQKILPQSVNLRESDSTLCIRMDDFIPLLVQGVQEQTARIDSLKLVVEELKAGLNKLKVASITGTGNTLNSTAILYQNIPNPFSRETQIGCFIPDGSATAMLYIYNMNGTQLQQYNISGKGKQAVTIYGNSFEPGMYLYALVIDSKEVDTKRMILTK